LLAASADFVIALYNPISRARRAIGTAPRQLRLSPAPSAENSVSEIED
jgi:precorrin-3B methylase